MKKLFLFICCSVQAFIVSAQTKTVQWEDGTCVEKHNKVVPNIQYDENSVYIKTDTVCFNVVAVVKNKNGNIICKDDIPVLTDEHRLQMSQKQLAEKHSVELYCEDNKYCGMFE